MTSCLHTTECAILALAGDVGETLTLTHCRGRSNTNPRNYKHRTDTFRPVYDTIEKAPLDRQQFFIQFAPKKVSNITIIVFFSSTLPTVKPIEKFVGWYRIGCYFCHFRRTKHTTILANTTKRAGIGAGWSGSWGFPGRTISLPEIARALSREISSKGRTLCI